MNKHLSQLFDRLNRTWARMARKSAVGRQNRFGHRRGLAGVPADIEFLERRSLLSAASAVSALSGHFAQPTYEVVKSAATPNASPAGFGYTPSQIETAYGFSANSQAGSGQTIAIVDAYDDPNITSDLAAFDSAFGISAPPSLKVVSEFGSTTNLPGVDPNKKLSNDWEVEESLDVEWAHALAPGANIVLVEAFSSNDFDLLTAVQTAANLPGVSVVSMSWGSGEPQQEASVDSVFTTPVGHQNVTFLASTGDNGAPSGFPAYSPNVVAVGGTTLNLGTDGNVVSESGWSGSGGGVSLFESQPAYQVGVVTQTTTKRAAPDVSFDADPNTGVPVYDTFSFGTSSPWAQIGGTSFSCPAWGAIIATVDQARVQNGLTTLDGPTQTLPILYMLDKTRSSDFKDITNGYNGFYADSGYDLVTGIGTPVVHSLVTDMSLPTTLNVTTASTTAVAGQLLGTVTVKVEYLGKIITSDNSTITLAVSGPGGFTAGSTATAQAVNGVVTFSNLTLDRSGKYQLIASDLSDLSGTSTITITPAPASKVAFIQVPATGISGSVLSTVQVAVEDRFGNVVTTNNSVISVSTASGPGKLASGSTTAVTAVNGVATFNNLILTAAGTYTLTASDAGLTSATSTSITVPLGTSNNFPLTDKVLSPTSVELIWPTVPGQQGYRIYYFNGTTKFLLGTASARATSYVVTGLKPGVSYQFQVEAFIGRSVLDSNSLSVSTNSSASVKSALSNSAASIFVDKNKNSNEDW